MKTELEEVAERFTPQSDKWTIKEIFIAGSKWQAEKIGLMEIKLKHTKTLLEGCERALEESFKQQERSYSEEEIKKAYCDGANLDYNIMISIKEGNEILQKWFEKFSKLKND